MINTESIESGDAGPVAAPDHDLRDHGLSIAIVGGSNLHRESLRLALANEDASLHVANVEGVDEAIRQISDEKGIDVLLVNAEANAEGCGDCLDSVKGLFHKRAEVPVVMLCGGKLCSRARHAAQQGLAGVIDSAATIGLVAGAVRVVAAGGTCFPASVIGEGQLDSAQPIPRASIFPQLSPRQQEVFSLLCEGRSNKELGRELKLTESTVKAHISAILKRLKVSNRTQAVLLATKANEV